MDIVKCLIGEEPYVMGEPLEVAAAKEIKRLRRLDAEYGRVETAIIMADPDFDGDSDHANCGDRLIASVERLAGK